MKNTGKCSKCGSSEVIRVPRSVGASSSVIETGLTVFSAVRMTRFLCGQCGYSEEWVEKPSDIEKLRQKYSDPDSRAV